MRLSARELHQRGVDSANSNRFAAARRALSEAARRTDDPDLQARIDGTRAYVLAQTGDPEAAEQLCRAALVVPEITDETRAVLNGQLGVLLGHAGHAHEAEELLTRAESALAEHSPERAACLMNRSVVRMQRYDLAGAAVDLESAAEAYRRLGDEEAAAEAQHNLGYAALLRGDLVTALTLMARSRPVFARTSEMATAISDLDRSEVLREAGLVTEAEELLPDVAARFGTQRMRRARGEAEFHLARTLLTHDPAAALRVARAARRRFDALGADGWAARTTAVELEARRRIGPPPPPAQFRSAAERLHSLGFEAEAAALRMRARWADATVRSVRIPVEAPFPVQVQAYQARAERALDAGRLSRARAAASDGLDLFSRWQASFGALDLQSSATMHGAGLLALGLRSAVRSADPAVMFDWAERARHLGQQVTPVRPPHDPELAADLSRLRMLRTELAGTDWVNDPEVRAVRARLRERQWSVTAPKGQRTRVRLEEALERMPAQALALCWLYTGDELHAVVAGRGDVTAVRVDWPRVRSLLDGMHADLDATALTHGTSMAPLVARSLAERTARLDQLLLQPLIRYLDGADAVALTVPGVLADVPWALLPSMYGRAFTLATSVSQWLDARARPLRRVGIAAGPHVARADGEVHAVARSWKDAAVRTGAEAKVSAVTELAADVDLLHIAAHGRHNADNPLFSGLELADGVLFGYDIDLIPTPPDTVVLSACELGRSAGSHEETLGMTRVWLHAGVRCVISSPALLADQQAARLLPVVHSHLVRGIAPARALAQAAEETGIRVPLHCHGDGF